MRLLLSPSAVLLLALPAAATSFIPIGLEPSFLRNAPIITVSGDGNVVAGTRSDGQFFRWTLVGGVEVLGTGLAQGVSGDGSTIVGSDAGGAFRWTDGGGLQTIGPGEARGASYDGSVVVANGAIGETGVYRWTESTGAVDLRGPLPEFERPDYAVDISADGSTVGGQWVKALYPLFEPFYWTEATGFTFPAPELQDDDNSIYDMSSDGSAFVGDYDEYAAFLWSESAGVVLLDYPDTFPLDFNNVLYGVSESGERAVGMSRIGFSEPDEQAMVWDAPGGHRPLEEDLIALGLGDAIAGWDLEFATGISDDGRWIVGSGVNPDGEQEYWVALIPEPSTAVLLAAGIVGLGLMRRRSGSG